MVTFDRSIMVTLNFGIGGDQDKDVFWRAINFPSLRTCYQLMWRKQYQ